jgi:hypothetical protein
MTALVGATVVDRPDRVGIARRKTAISSSSPSRKESTMILRSRMLVLGCLAALVASTSASATIHRYALAAGANYGGANRATLKYAVSDAERVARVMETLGGVHSSDLVLLSQPSRTELEAALEDLRQRMASSRGSSEETTGSRTEVMIYFSGHANETGLLLGDEALSYRSLRSWMDSVDADVRIAVLDACASGTITRIKGGQRRNAFLLDESSETRGHAFLTSSSADEVAQESERVGGSFFTHYLVSGLRGAADTSGEGKVTLNEAYQFAFHETLGRTSETQAGPQHASYDINLSGTGDVVMTDVRETSATLVLGDDLSGRFFIRNADEQLIVELYKLHGRSVELGIEPGTYQVRCENDSGSSVSSTSLEDGGHSVLATQHFTITEQEPVVVRGGRAAYPFGALQGRWRLGLRLGSWYHGKLGTSESDFLWETHDRTGGVTFSYWLNEKWALDFTAWTFMNLVREETPSNAYIAAFLFGGKRYFPNLGGLRPEIRPFLSAAGGPYLRSFTPVYGETVETLMEGETIESVAAGGNIGGGFDIQLARWFMIGTKLGYSFTSDFTREETGAFGNRTSYEGFELSVDFSILFGKGRAPVF